MKAVTQTEQENVLYTYIPVSLEALQGSFEQQVQPITIAQNVIVKKLPDGKYALIGSNEFLQNQNITFSKIPQNNDYTSNGNVQYKTNDLPVESAKAKVEIKQKQVIDDANVEQINCKTDKKVKKSGRPKSNTENLKCNICGEVFNKNVNYRKHLEVHRNVKKYKCDQCFESYDIEDNFKLHRAIHEKGQPTCPLCGRKFQRLASLKSHLLMHQVDETYTCKECLAEFEKEEEYNKHVDSHNEEKLSVSDNIPYICSYCNYLFQDAKEYKEHVSYHIKIKKLVLTSKRTRKRNQNNKEYAHKCVVCSKSFPKSCLLERHSRIHSGERPFACTKCNKAFAQKSTLQIHLFKHTGIKPFKCTLCPAEYFQKGNLRVHVEKTHTAPPNCDQTYKCTQCTCVFRKVASLNAHITKAHGGVREVDDSSLTALREQLSELEKISGNGNNAQSTNNSNNNNNIEHVAPSIIDITNNGTTLDEVAHSNVTFVKLADSSVEGSFRRYLVKQRRVGSIKWFICSYCSKEFKKPSDLIRHIRVHTREKPYKCTRCPQSFALKSTLISHMNTHFSKREYLCVHCLKMFSSARTLNVHYRKHTKNTQALHYKCSTCNKTFNTLTKASLHMQVHDNDNSVIRNAPSATANNPQLVMKQPMLETANGLLLPVPAPKPKIPYANVEEYKNRPHRCNVCNAAFKKAVHMKRHMLIHSGEKNYKCDICPKSFYTSYALKEHVQLHSNVRNFACKICTKRFTTNLLLKRHLVKHSTSRPYVCPYCKRRFKTVTLCRKHINVHRRDINFEGQSLAETGEVDGLSATISTKMIDLSDALSENPFNLLIPQTSSNCAEFAVTPSDNSHSVTVALHPPHVTKEIQRIPRKIKSAPNRKPRKCRLVRKSTVSSVAVQEDGNQIGTVNENVSQVSTSELQEQLNQEYINQLTANTQMYIDKSGNYALATTTGAEIENVEVTQNSQEDPVAYSTIYISYDDLHSVNANLYNTLLPQVKLEGNDPILMSTISEPQESNILFMDPTLAQSTEYQSESQNFEAFNPIMFNSSISVNDLNLGSNNLSVSLPTIPTMNMNERVGESDQTMLPCLGDMNRKSKSTESRVLLKSNEGIDNSKLILSTDNINLNDNLIITLNNDDLKSSDLSYFSSINFNLSNNQASLNDAVDTINLNSALISVPESFQNAVSCSVCKCDFDTVNELQKHQCSDISTLTKDMQVGSNEDHNFIRMAVNKKLRRVNDEQNNAMIPDLHDQLQTTHIEINSEEPVQTAEHRSKTKKFKCAQCERTFSTEVKLLKHISMHRDKKAENMCTYCDKTFKKPSDLKRHIRTHTGEKPFACEKCNKSFSLKSTLQSHLRTHNPGGNKEFNCGVCNTNYSCKASLRTHMLVHTGVKPYPCHLCPAKFRTSAHRKSHVSNHLKDNVMKKSNENKTKRLGGVKVVSNYIESMLSQSEAKAQTDIIMASNSQTEIVQDNLQCDDNQIIETVDALNMNDTIQIDLLQQLQNSGLLLEDTTVDVLASSLIQLETDSLQDKGDPNLSSILNAERFVSLPANAEHLKSRDFECDLCHKKYISKAVLRKHQKMHKQGHKCTKCGKLFHSEDLLNKHAKLHLGYRPFSCLLCANSFSEEGSLKTHMKRIHNAS